MSRAEKKAAAEARRKEWRLRWVELAKKNHHAGSTMRECVELVGKDADALALESPTLRSEIGRALVEFIDRLVEALLVGKNQQPGAIP